MSDELKPGWLSRQMEQAERNTDELPEWAGGTGKALSDLRRQLAEAQARIAELEGAWQAASDWADLEANTNSDLISASERIMRLEAALRKIIHNRVYDVGPCNDGCSKAERSHERYCSECIARYALAPKEASGA